MLKQLRLKFIVVNMGIVAAMLLIIFGLVYHFTDADLESKGIELVTALAQDSAPITNSTQAQLPYFTVQINPFGDLVISGTSYYDLTDEDFLQDLIQYVYTAGESEGIIEKYDLRFCLRGGLGYQRIAFVDISGQKAVLASLVQTSLLIGTLSLVMFLGISILLARWAVKPVERAWQQQKQFVSDASHELKTPLTVIMSNAELLQGADRDEEITQRSVCAILTMCSQMRHLVESLLELARADNGQVCKSFETVDLSMIVSDGLLPFEPVLYEKGLVLESQIENGIHLVGNARYLGQILDILLDNAGRYSAPGIVDVKLRRQGKGQCLLTVSNPGEPIAQTELEKIFERFYRTDQARSRTGSFGLGLSIAKSIVQEHKGKIWCRSNPTGNCFFVQLPCCEGKGKGVFDQGSA